MTKVVFLFLGFSFGISKASAIDLRDYLTENDIKSIGAIIANNETTAKVNFHNFCFSELQFFFVL